MFGWRDKNRDKKKDLIAALEEAAFQDAVFRTFEITVRAAQSDPSVGAELQGQIDLYLRTIIDALVESEIKLYGFRGKSSDWTDFDSAIREGKLTFPGEYESRIEAATGVEICREQLAKLLADVESDYASPAQTIEGVASAFQKYRDGLSRTMEQLEDKGIEAGLIDRKKTEQIRMSAMKKVFKSIPKG